MMSRLRSSLTGRRRGRTWTSGSRCGRADESDSSNPRCTRGGSSGCGSRLTAPEGTCVRIRAHCAAVVFDAHRGTRRSCVTRTVALGTEGSAPAALRLVRARGHSGRQPRSSFREGRHPSDPCVCGRSSGFVRGDDGRLGGGRGQRTRSVGQAPSGGAGSSQGTAACRNRRRYDARRRRIRRAARPFSPNLPCTPPTKPAQ